MMMMMGELKNIFFICNWVSLSIFGVLELRKSNYIRAIESIYEMGIN